jgi:hypothetical protein
MVRFAHVGLVTFPPVSPPSHQVSSAEETPWEEHIETLKTIVKDSGRYHERRWNVTHFNVVEAC